MTVQPMPARRVLRHKVNPFPTRSGLSQVVLFKPDDYQLSLLLSLSASALRVLFILAARIDATTGTVRCSKKHMHELLGMQRPNITHSLSELIAVDLIQKGQSLDTYWINPKVFPTVDILFR